MAVFNPKILDASIRDVASCLSDNQKVDLLLYAMKSLHIEGRSRTLLDNAVQSCLLVSTLTPENVAKVRILRARSKIAAGNHFSAQEDLQAALDVEPDNPEAQALLHQRSVTVEKLLAPLPSTAHQTAFFRLSPEVWRLILLNLPRRDLYSLLFVPHPMSAVARQLIFREVSLFFNDSDHGDILEVDDETELDTEATTGDRDMKIRSAKRSADILTQIIVDPSFAACIRTLKIYMSDSPLSSSARGAGAGLALLTGMLTNALPKLTNLKNVHLAAGSEGISAILSVLQLSHPRLRGLSVCTSSSTPDLSAFKHLAYLACRSPFSTSVSSSINAALAQNRSTLRSIYLEATPLTLWTLPTNLLAIRNLTSLTFCGAFRSPSATTAPSTTGSSGRLARAEAAQFPLTDILTHGHQLEYLSITITHLEYALSPHIRPFTSPSHSSFSTPTSLPACLPFLRHFHLTLSALSRPFRDPHLFPVLTDLLRSRPFLRSLTLRALGKHEQKWTGYDAAIWGVLPSLVGLKSLRMSWPGDLAPGLGGWLVPRSVRALEVDLENVEGGFEAGRGPVLQFLQQLRQGVPPSLRYIGFPVPIELRRGMTSELTVGELCSLVVEHGFPMVRVARVGERYKSVRMPRRGFVGCGTSGSGGGSGGGGKVELETWPLRRVVYHRREWLEWLGCEDAVGWSQDDFPV